VSLPKQPQEMSNPRIRAEPSAVTNTPLSPVKIAAPPALNRGQKKAAAATSSSHGK